MRNPIVQGLLWRAALKSFHYVPPATVDIQPILDAMQLAPSAFGLQPYDIHVITDDAVKQQLKGASYNQPQVTDCSHLLVFCAHQYPPYAVNRFVTSCEIEKDAPDFACFLHRNYDSQTFENFAPFASNQAFIALGVGVVTAANLRIGACPMSGFEPDKVAAVLQLPTIQSYKSSLPAASTASEPPNENPNTSVLTKKDYLKWPVAYLAIGSTLDDTEWHKNSRKQYKRRRIPFKDLYFWHGMRTTRPTGAMEDEDAKSQPPP